jgi:hypothetical protein
MMQVCSGLTGKMRAAPSFVKFVELKGLRDEHFDKQRAQRLHYYDNRQAGKLKPESVLSIIIDAMDQGKTELPVMRRRAKGDNADLVKQKVMGVMAHGWGTWLYIGHPPLRCGANFVLECLWRTLMKLNREYEGLSLKWPPRLKLQMDNASDNKAFAVLGTFSFFVKANIFEKVTINFLIVGHTHEDIDQYFSTIARRLNKIVYSRTGQGIYSLEDFRKVVIDAFQEEGKKPKVIIQSDMYFITRY